MRPAARTPRHPATSGGVDVYASLFHITAEEVPGWFADTVGERFGEEAIQSAANAWIDDDLSLRDRSLIVVAAVIAQGGLEALLRMHTRWALDHGSTPAELRRSARLLAIYTGFGLAGLEDHPRRARESETRVDARVSVSSSNHTKEEPMAVTRHFDAVISVPARPELGRGHASARTPRERCSWSRRDLPTRPTSTRHRSRTSAPSGRSRDPTGAMRLRPATSGTRFRCSAARLSAAPRRSTVRWRCEPSRPTSHGGVTTGSPAGATARRRRLHAPGDHVGWRRDLAWTQRPLSDPSAHAGDLSEIQNAFLDAALAAGPPANDDFNAGKPGGVGPLPKNVVDGTRINTGMAYLTSAVRSRENLTIRPETEVDRVIFEGSRATGVARVDGTVIPAGEVILSAGTYGSPSILLRSGVGRRLIFPRWESL